MGNQKPIAFLILAGLLGGGAWWTFRTPDLAPPKVSEASPTPVKPTEKGPVPVTAAFQVDAKAVIPAEERLLMPDGSFVPTLNGVKNPAKIAWGSTPYSPIVRKQFDPTITWYVHADGTYTTTMMQWRSDHGREDAVTLCLHPAAPAGIEGAPDEGTVGPTKK